MKPQFQHEVTTSFVMWLDHHLPYKAEAFSKKTGLYYYQEDDRIDSTVYASGAAATGYYAYASPYKQWIYDSGINGLNNAIPDSISGIALGSSSQQAVYDRGSYAIKFDFENGRVLVPTYWGSTTGTFSGTFPVKDFNLYLTNETEEHLIIESKYDVNSRFSQDVSGIKPYDPVVPCIFILANEARNTPFAFGGEDLTRMYYRLVIFAENLYELDGALSLLNDCHEKCFPNVGYDAYPLNEWGDIKKAYDGNDKAAFSYADEFRTNNDFICVDKVFASKISKDVSRKNNPGLFLGFVDMELIKARYPRL